MVTYSTTYNLKKPTVGQDDDVWGGYLNDAIDTIDDVLDGTTPVTGIDINSGTIDNAVIGGTTAAAGTFTTLTANTSLGVTGNITVSGTVDGVDIASRDAVLTTTTTTANAALPKTGGTMTGAITFAAAQTFDGRDVSVDGAKLDGIESGATADQTASEILTAIKTVDGSGSGLDADTVDGIQASSFLRSDAADSTASTISFTGDIQVGDQIFHHGDTDTYMQFHAANQWRVVTGGTEMLEVNDTNVIVQSGLTVNGTLTLGANVINDVEDIYLRDKLFHDGDTDTYLGFGTNTINLVTGNSTSATFNSSGIFVTDGSVAEDYDALSGTTPTCNVDNGGMFSLTMTGNTTFTFSGASSGYAQGFILQLTGNGSTVTWPTSVDWAGGTAPDAPASGETDIYVFITRDGGTTWYGVLSVDAAA